MNLIKVLKEKIDIIENDTFEREIEYHFYDKLSKELYQNKEFISVKTGAILCAILGINSDVKFEHIYFLFKEKTPLFTNDYDERDIMRLLDVTWSLRDNKFIYDILDDNEDLAKTYLKLSKILDLEKRKKINSMIKKYKQVGLELFEDFQSLKIFTKIVQYDVEKILETFLQFSNYKHNYDIIQKIKEKKSKQFKIYDIDGREIRKTNYLFEMRELNQFFRQLTEKNFELTKLKNRFNSSKQKKKMIYEKTIQYLESLNEVNSIDIPNDILNKLDDDLLIDLLKLVLNNDRKIYSDLQIENIKKIHYNEVETKFLQNNIDVNKLSVEEKNILITNIRPEELDKILIYLNKNEWKWIKKHPNFVQIMLNTNETIFSCITYWLNNRIISMETVCKNIGILLENNNIKVNGQDVLACYNKVRTNINLLSKITDLNNKTYKNGDVLFIDTNILKTLIELIKKYKLDLKNDNSKNYSLDILLDYSKFDDLDTFIELGFKDYITNNSQNLNTDSKDIISRLSIFVNTGLDPFTLEDRLLSSIVTGKNFFIPNDQLNQFNLVNVDDCVDNEHFDILKNNNRLTISKSTLDLDIVKYLDNLYKVSELEYNFDNIIISRIKFLRNLECLIKNNVEFNKEMIMNCLTHKSSLDQDSIKFIEQTLYEYNGKQYKKER